MSGLAIVALIFLVLLLMWVSFLCGAWRAYRQDMAEDDDLSAEITSRSGLLRFYVQRNDDITGISGTGVVVEGVVFSDGWGVTHWLDQAPMHEPKTEIWHKRFLRPGGEDAFTKISGHGGRTKVVWLDECDSVPRKVEKESDMMKEDSDVRLVPQEQEA